MKNIISCNNLICEEHEGNSEEHLQADGRTHRKRITIPSCFCPSVFGILIFDLHFFRKMKEPTKVQKKYPISALLIIHKYCDYFVSIIVEIRVIKISTVGNHYPIPSFNIGPFRQKQLHHCRLSMIGGYHQGSVSNLQDSRRGDS